MAPITDLVKKVLDDIRVEDGYAMILDNAPGASVIVSADKNLDITDRVVSRLRATPAAKAKAPGNRASDEGCAAGSGRRDASAHAGRRRSDSRERPSSRAPAVRADSFSPPRLLRRSSAGR